MFIAKHKKYIMEMIQLYQEKNNELTENCKCIQKEILHNISHENKCEWAYDQKTAICYCKILDLAIKIQMLDENISFCYINNEVIIFMKDLIGKSSLGFSLKEYFVLSSHYFEYEADPSYVYFYSKISNDILRSSKETLSIKNFKLLSASEDLNSKYIDENDQITIIENAFKKSFDKLFIDDNYVVLFSGGIDSMLVVIFLHHTIDPNLPIYLINTSFIENKSYDRKSGLLGYDDLKSNFKTRNFIFIENNVPFDECNRHIDKINRLIYPKNTPMDLNIGMCLYFGSIKAKEYSSFVFLGSGADELFGGYKKHKEELENIKNTLKNDLKNIWERNLGRDDRIISSNNISCKLPFLDTNLIKLGISLSEKLLINDENGKLMNKIVLRKILSRNGFERVSKMSKRAMQYGSGAFKWERTKATNNNIVFD